MTMTCKAVTMEMLDEYVRNAPPEPPKPKPKAAQPAGANAQPPRGKRRAGFKEATTVARCRGCLKKAKFSVEGNNGSGPIWSAARLIWNDFGIDAPDGPALLAEYNAASCVPPWDEEGKDGWRRVWERAVAAGPGPEGRGHLLLQDRPEWRAERGAQPTGRSAKPESATPGDFPELDDVVPDEATDSSSDLPEIVHNQRQYRDVEADAARALIAANVPPRVFVGNGCGLIDLQRRDKESPLTARELDAASLRSVFARVATWYRVKDDGSQVDDYPPQPLLTSFGAIGDWPGIPRLTSIVSYPVYGPGWVLNATQGYHPASGLYCDLGDLVVPPVADRPTTEDVAVARDLIVTDLFGDFPFVDQASRANAVAMLILPVIRHAIAGPTPLALIDAPTQGTGKSLLAELATLVTVGEIPEAITPDLSDDEWNKTLLALLIEGRPVVYLDNVNKKLDSGSLASAVTAKFKKGRMLGQTKVVDARINVCWIVTGNNFECSAEIARRCYWMRIDRGVESPSQYTGYRHENITEWAFANRPRLLGAILTLVNAWLAAGRPPGTATLGKFEAWVAAVGGILKATGIDGLLDNAEAFRRAATSQASEMPEFIAKWHERFATVRVTSAELFDCAEGVLTLVLNAKDVQGRKTQLGKFLRTQRDKVYGEWRIRFSLTTDGKEDKDHCERPRYYLEKVRGNRKAEVETPNEYANTDGEFDLTA